MSVEESGRYSYIVALVKFVKETAKEANDPVGVSESREREFSRRGQNKSGKSKGTSRFGEQQQLQALGNQQNQQQQREESCQGTGHGRIDDRGKKQLSRCLCRSAHGLDVCSQFIAMSLRDQLHFVWEKRLCFSCLDGKHAASECKRPSAGYVRGCSGKRCTLLHQSFQGAKKNSGESRSKPYVGSRRGQWKVPVVRAAVHSVRKPR